MQPVERISILVVDDRSENALAVKAVLGDVDYEVVTAQSGAQALKRLLKQDFALILLDVQMPSMDGFETARLIAQREASRHIPIIFLTAVGADVASIYRGYSVGAVDYLVKPIEPDIVRAKVAVFADLYRKNRQIVRQEEALREAERERSEEALREREAEYEATFEKAALGIAHVGSDGRFLRVNRKFCDIAGYEKEEFPGLALNELLEREDAARHVQALHKLLEGALESFRHEVRLCHKTGRLVWAELSVSLLRDSAGKPKRFITLAEDITERKRTEVGQQALARASEVLLGSLDFQAVVRGIAESVVPSLADLCIVQALDTASNLVTVSASAHEGASGAAHLGESMQHLPPGLEWGYAQVLGTLEPVLVREVTDKHLAEWSTTREALLFLKDIDPSGVIVVPLRTRNVIRGAITLVSLSEQRRFEVADVAIAEELARRAVLGIENARLYREAQDAIGARDEFLSIASHELRTPLTPLQIQLQRLLGLRGEDPLTYLPKDQLRAILRRSSLQVGRLAALIDNLLDVSRIGSERLVLDPATADLSELARDVVGRFSEASRGAGSSLNVQTDGKIFGHFDPLRMEQVLTNLVSNAIKYGDHEPVNVSVARENGTGIMTVEDHGIGIPAEKLPLIFDRFERGASSRSYGGLGLGLYIARRLVEAHGGSIDVTSEPGSGSTFTVRLPLHPERVEVPAEGVIDGADRGSPSSVRPPRLEAKTVLLVEDDPEIRECLEDLLKGEGYEVVSAANGLEALRRLTAPQAEAAPDLIILDLMMPVMDGARFRDEQRKIPNIAKIPVLIVSGDGTSADKAAAMDAAGCLKKPVDINELLRLVNRACGPRLASSLPPASC